MLCCERGFTKLANSHMLLNVGELTGDIHHHFSCLDWRDTPPLQLPRLERYTTTSVALMTPNDLCNRIVHVQIKDTEMQDIHKICPKRRKKVDIGKKKEVPYTLCPERLFTKLANSQSLLDVREIAIEIHHHFSCLDLRDTPPLQLPR